MKWSIKMKAGAVLLALALLSSIGVGCRQILTLDSYMAVVPKVLQSGPPSETNCSQATSRRSGSTLQTQVSRRRKMLCMPLTQAP